MRRLMLSLVLLVPVAATSPSAAPQQVEDVLASMLTPPMTAVAILIARDQWDPRLDDLVQRAPAAARLGSKWTSSLPAWQKARNSLTAREEAVFARFTKAPELAAALRQVLALQFPNADAASLLALLRGPGGPAIIRFQASSEFSVTSMTATPDGPKPGDPKWFEQLKALRQRFSDRIGPQVPPEDASHQADVERFIGIPAGMKFQRLWMSVVGKATTTLDTGLNLMIFDNRDAIATEIAAAVASVK